jgi:hypothetical protein
MIFWTSATLSDSAAGSLNNRAAVVDVGVGDGAGPPTVLPLPPPPPQPAKASESAAATAVVLLKATLKFISTKAPDAGHGAP